MLQDSTAHCNNNSTLPLAARDNNTRCAHPLHTMAGKRNLYPFWILTQNLFSPAATTLYTGLLQCSCNNLLADCNIPQSDCRCSPLADCIMLPQSDLQML
jgi:hypothetical protein